MGTLYQARTVLHSKPRTGVDPTKKLSKEERKKAISEKRAAALMNALTKLAENKEFMAAMENMGAPGPQAAAGLRRGRRLSESDNAVPGVVVDVVDAAGFALASNRRLRGRALQSTTWLQMDDLGSNHVMAEFQINIEIIGRPDAIVAAATDSSNQGTSSSMSLAEAFVIQLLSAGANTFMSLPTITQDVSLSAASATDALKLMDAAAALNQDSDVDIILAPAPADTTGDTTSDDFGVSPTTDATTDPAAPTKSSSDDDDDSSGLDNMLFAVALVGVFGLLGAGSAAV
jgi:hypothetical protein